MFIEIYVYYYIQVLNFALVAKLLFKLLKANTLEKQKEAQRGVINYLKEAITSALALALLDYSLGREIIIGVDASQQGGRGHLLQVGEDGKIYPVRFKSVLQLKEELKQHLTKLECCAVLQILKKFQVQLYRVHFTIKIDA